ncbi:hypothetical protein V8E55_008278 [Tylopilus felleus]
MHKSLSTARESAPSRARAMLAAFPPMSSSLPPQGRTPDAPRHRRRQESHPLTKCQENPQDEPPSPLAQLTPSKFHLLSVEKGQRKGPAASVVGGGRHETGRATLLARTGNLNGTASVANGSGPLSQVNGTSTILVNADGSYRWHDHDADDTTLEMITDVGEDTGERIVAPRPLVSFVG